MIAQGGGAVDELARGGGFGALGFSAIGLDVDGQFFLWREHAPDAGGGRLAQAAGVGDFGLKPGGKFGGRIPGAAGYEAARAAHGDGVEGGVDLRPFGRAGAPVGREVKEGGPSVGGGGSQQQGKC